MRAKFYDLLKHHPLQLYHDEKGRFLWYRNSYTRKTFNGYMSRPTIDPKIRRWEVLDASKLVNAPQYDDEIVLQNYVTNEHLGVFRVNGYKEYPKRNQRGFVIYMDLITGPGRQPYTVSLPPPIILEPFEGEKELMSASLSQEEVTNSNFVFLISALWFRPITTIRINISSDEEESTIPDNKIVFLNPTEELLITPPLQTVRITYSVFKSRQKRFGASLVLFDIFRTTIFVIPVNIIWFSDLSLSLFEEDVHLLILAVWPTEIISPVVVGQSIRLYTTDNETSMMELRVIDEVKIIESLQFFTPSNILPFDLSIFSFITIPSSNEMSPTLIVKPTNDPLRIQLKDVVMIFGNIKNAANVTIQFESLGIANLFKEKTSEMVFLLLVKSPFVDNFGENNWAYLHQTKHIFLGIVVEVKFPSDH